MSTLINKKLLTLLYLSILITACSSNSPVIKSATADKVEINAPAEKFLDAYDLAKKECEKNTKTTLYIPDNTVGLEELAFDCVGEEVEVAAEDTTTEKTEEITIEIEDSVTDEVATEEEIPAQ